MRPRAISAEAPTTTVVCRQVPQQHFFTTSVAFSVDLHHKRRKRCKGRARSKNLFAAQKCKPKNAILQFSIRLPRLRRPRACTCSSSSAAPAPAATAGLLPPPPAASSASAASAPAGWAEAGGDDGRTRRVGRSSPVGSTAGATAAAGRQPRARAPVEQSTPARIGACLSCPPSLHRMAARTGRHSASPPPRENPRGGETGA
jgi:hypothetical protein